MAVLTDRLDLLLGDRAAKPLAADFDLHTVEDLLRHYPLRYATRGEALTEDAPEDGSHLTIIGTVVTAKLQPMRQRKGYLLRVVADTGKQRVDMTFFNGKKFERVIVPGLRAMFSGTVKYWRNTWGLTHPGHLALPGDDDGDEPVVIRGSADMAGMARGIDGTLDLSIFDRALVPVYPATSRIQSWDIGRCVRQVLDQLDPVEDPLPAGIRRERGLLDLDTALRTVHFPDTEADVGRAKDRLRFDEAAAMALVLAQRRQQNSRRSAPACPPRADGIAAAFERQLPFRLTDGQLQVAAEIAADLARPHPMSRLLQGEVGSGKTIVALRAMLQAVDAGKQCALLAPTEVLAAQHYRSLTTMLGPLGQAGELGAADVATRVVLLSGSMGTAAKRTALLAAVSGEAGIVIGTHALIQDNVEFYDLGLVVIDEQHRFGVEQRDALRAKARDGMSPHLLVMTATPIPRTIAITTLGDLETSTLRELPKGRSPIVTRLVGVREHPRWVDRAWARILEEVAAGRQAYVVCSRIGDEAGDAKRKGGAEPPDTHAVLELFDELRHGPLRELRVGLLHGRQPADEKDTAMRAFTAGETDVLVCTTVVEVGVDVPNATVMVIMDADRFGVSQLHQLRGRIGRGGHQGLCLLISEAAPGGPAMTRLQQVADTTDGFELALLDLRARREGDVLGAAQSGIGSTLRLLSLLDDLEVITAAQRFARDVVDTDPDLRRHPGLAGMVRSALDARRLDYLGKA